MQLHREIDSIRAAGAEVYVIGNGSPSFIEGFRETTSYTGVVYTDPSLAVFTMAHLKRGVMSTLNPFALGKTLGAFARGHRQGLTKGDNWQQGGVLVIAANGKVLWHHASDRPGDNAEASQIVAALKTA